MDAMIFMYRNIVLLDYANDFSNDIVKVIQTF